MLAKPKEPRIPLPKGWQGCVKSAVLDVIALAHYAIVYARAWAADSINARVRLSAEKDRLQEECALLREELRIKDTPAPHRSRRSYARIAPATSAVLVHRIFRFRILTVTFGFDKRYCILQPETLKNSFSEVTMLTKPQRPRIHLPKGWQDCVKSVQMFLRTI